MLFTFKFKKREDEYTKYKKIIEAKRKQCDLEGRYCMFDNPYASRLVQKPKGGLDEHFEDRFEIVSDITDNCRLSKDTGEYIERLISEEDKTLLIHRTLLYDDNQVNNILTEGLFNNGHAFVGGGRMETPSPTLTTTPVSSLGGFINLFSNYKDNNYVFLLQVPKEYINEDGNFVDLDSSPYYVYDMSGTIPRFKPEYVIGIIKKNDNGLDRYYSKEEILNKSLKK